MKLRRRLLVSAALVLALAGGMLLAAPSSVHAEGLQIRPLMYREVLEQGKSKQGFVDVSNPSSVAVTVAMDVRGFRQTDGQGNLRFFTSQVISSGITLDLKEVELGPREAVRVYFAIDSNKLPKGDIFAAIFAATKSPAGAGIVPSAQVGMLLLIQNGQPGPRKVDVQFLNVSPIQIGEAVSGAATLKNPAPVEPSSGFFPQVTVSLRPIGEVQQQIAAPLVMSGISREVPFKLAASRIGLYKLTVSSGSSSAGTWAFVVTGFWRWVLLGLAGLIVLTALRARRIRHRKKLQTIEPEATVQAAESEVTHVDTVVDAETNSIETVAPAADDPVIEPTKPASPKAPATAPELAADLSKLAAEPPEPAITPRAETHAAPKPTVSAKKRSKQKLNSKNRSKGTRKQASRKSTSK